MAAERRASDVAAERRASDVAAERRTSDVAAERRTSDVAAERRRKVWTRENNIQVLHCYFKSNPAQRGYRKRMLQIWNDNNNFNTTSQRLADQARMILNKKFFSDLEIIEISGQENQGIQTYQETTKQNNQHAGNQNLAQPTLKTQELTPEQRMDIELVQQIMADEKSKLPSLRNIEWKKVKKETEKINKILMNIPTNNITELNNLIYAGAKLVCDRIGAPLRNTNRETNRNTKAGWEFRLEEQIKQLRQQTNTLNRNTNTHLAKKVKRQHQIKLEEVKQKISAIEGRLKRYRERTKQYKQNRTFQNNENKFYEQING